MGRHQEHKYLLIDTETTGLEPAKHALVELACYPLDTRLEMRSDIKPFHSTVRPHEDAVIDERALRINKHTWITDPDSAGYAAAAEPEAFWKSFKEYLAEAFDEPEPTWIVLLGWNVRFDSDFLAAFMHRHFGETAVSGQTPWPLHYHVVDLLGIVRYYDARIGRTRPSYRLEKLAEEYFGTMSDFIMHTAMGDAQMALKVAHAVEEEYHDFVRRAPAEDGA